MLSQTEKSRIQGLFKANKDFPILFKADLILRLFKKALSIQVLFKPVRTLANNSLTKSMHSAKVYGLCKSDMIVLESHVSMQNNIFSSKCIRSTIMACAGTYLFHEVKQLDSCY